MSLMINCVVHYVYQEAPTLPPITPTTPITVSIRLTAALVLRNLADQSSVIKRYVSSALAT